MKLDKELIQLITGIIERNLETIEKIVDEGFEKFKGNLRNELVSKNALVESIDACIAINNHIIAVKGFRRPEDYRNNFIILKEIKILDEELSRKMHKIAKSKDLLVHKYVKIEKEDLFNIIKTNKEDIKEFVREILRYLSGNE